MSLPSSFTTVTPLSKMIALLLFVLLPFIGFYLGIQYQKIKEASPPSTTRIGCTQEAKICPDGSAVGRHGPTCEFDPCPPYPLPTETIYCAQDVKTCPDGTYVTRQAPTCEFAACPQEEKKRGSFCGGIANIQCPTGMRCASTGMYPDAGGTCQ